MIPREEPKEPSNPDSPRSIDRLSEYAGLLNDVSILIAELEVNQITDQTEHNFSFELIGENQVVIPKSVRAVMPEIDQITVSISKEDIDAPSILSIEFVSDSRTVSVSRSGHGKATAEPDMMLDTAFKTHPGANLLQTAKQQLHGEPNSDFEKRFTAIEKVSNAELNTLIMSLIYPDTERGYEMFADVNFLDPAAYESLKESFRLSALNNSNSMTYDFHSSESRFSYLKQEGQPISFTFQYIENEEGRLVTLQSNMETDFRLQFTTDYEMMRSTGFTTDEKMPYYPTSEELHYLRSVLMTEIASLNPTPVAFLEDQRIDDKDAEAVFIERGGDVLSRRYVREVLEQLGFDAPDPGTA
ncbi:MAG TPA: hypothetical protein VIM31_00725 [Candidatus Microsaccharimonas sp.]|jgi:hypothetical protein